jgi:hypothetical protein
VSDDLRAALRRLPDEWEHTGHLRSAGTDMGARANNEQVDREVEALREWVDDALAAAEPVRDPEPPASGIDALDVERLRHMGQYGFLPEGMTAEEFAAEYARLTSDRAGRDEGQ